MFKEIFIELSPLIKVSLKTSSLILVSQAMHARRLNFYVHVTFHGHMLHQRLLLQVYTQYMPSFHGPLYVRAPSLRRDYHDKQKRQACSLQKNDSQFSRSEEHTSELQS